MKTDFFFKRIHSLTGLGLVLFLLMHLWTNSQVAWTIWWGSDGFEKSVNALNALPFLRVLEIGFLAVPLVVHGYFGWRGSVLPHYSVLKSIGGEPSLGDLPSNRLYTWQRWSGLILMVLIIWHVLEMRLWHRPVPIPSNVVEADTWYLVQLKEQGERVVSSLGKGVFLVLQETFKNIWISLLYTSFVVIASYHAARGVFTAGISWGILVFPLQRKRGWFWSKILFVVLVCLGMVPIWSIYLSESM